MSEDDRDSNDHILAGEYVLGVSSFERRRAIEQRMSEDRAFAALVERWQADFSAFNADYAEVKPLPATFGRIEQRLFGQEARTESKPGLLDTIGFWRWLSAATSIVAIVAVVYASGLLQPQNQGLHLVAQLSAPKSDMSLLASFDASSGRVRLIPVAAGSTDEKSLQLWLVPPSGNPQSLGVFPTDSRGELLIPADMRSKVSDGATLAVSLEPFGGSPTGLPTGPVIASGKARAL